MAGEGGKAKKSSSPAATSPLILPGRPKDADRGADADVAGAEREPYAPAVQAPPAKPAAAASPAPEPIPVPGLNKGAPDESPERKAMARSRAELKRSDGELRSRVELEAATELLATGKPEEALALFRRAARLDVARELAPNPHAGEASALSRLGRCDEALRVADAIAEAHPTFSGTPRVLRDVADCMDAAGDPRKARLVRARAPRAAAPVAAQPAASPADRQAEVTQALAAQALPIARCEQLATSQGELPAAAGTWRLTLSVTPDGTTTSATARGPQPAPLLQNCLEAVAQRLTYGPAPGAPRVVTVRLPIRSRPEPASAPTKAR